MFLLQFAELLLCMCHCSIWNHTFFTCDSFPCCFIINAPFSSGWTSEAEDRRRQHASVCRERPLGSLSEHRWTRAAGSTATDTDAAGGEEQLIKHTLTDSAQIIPAFITTHQAALLEATPNCCRQSGRWHQDRLCFLSCFTPPLERPSRSTEGQWQRRALQRRYRVTNQSFTRQINSIVWASYCV